MMTRVDGHPSLHWQPSPGVTAVSRCPTGGLSEYRLEERPVLNTLLEHVPGDVPFSTHLELEAARARLVHRSVGEAIDRLGERTTAREKGADRGGEVNRGVEVDEGELAVAREVVTKKEPKEQKAEPSGRDMDRIERGAVAYTLPRRRWPIGGLIDLVV